MHAQCACVCCPSSVKRNRLSPQAAGRRQREVERPNGNILARMQGPACSLSLSYYSVKVQHDAMQCTAVSVPKTAEAFACSTTAPVKHEGCLFLHNRTMSRPTFVVDKVPER